MPEDKDKLFWITIRAALIMMVRAIEKRYMVEIKVQPIREGDSVSI